MKTKSIILSFAFTLLGIFIYINPQTRKFFSEFGTTNKRTILASLETQKLRGPHPFKILKIKEDASLWLEVYFVHKTEKGTETEFHKKLALKGSFDGHILVQEQASNLALANIDADKELEILAPTYDRSMTPVLNIYKYDPILEEFRYIDANSAKPSF